MKTKLKNGLRLNRTLLILSLICILLGVFSCVVGELLIPFIVAVLSTIYLFDTKSKRIYSIVVSILLLVLNLATVFMRISVSTFAPCSIILSLILAFSFLGGQSKSDASYVMSIVAAGFSLVAYMLFAMIKQDSFTLESAIEYYTALADSLRAVFVDMTVEIYSASGLELDVDQLSSIFDKLLYMIISYMIIGGFVISGIAMKLFGLIVGYISLDKGYIKKWRFSATKIYAYVYLILIVLSLFTIDLNSIFAISVQNLYNIFMVIFAYVGFNVALDALNKRMKPVLSVIVLLVSLVLFASFALQILAALGVLYTIRTENQLSNSSGENK